EEEDITYLPPYIKVTISQVNREYHSSIRCKKNLEKSRVVDVPCIKPPKITPRSKKLVQNPESYLIGPWNEKVTVTEANESYYNPGVPSKECRERSTRVKENQRQEKEIEVDPEVTLEDLVESYLEVLDTWISELGRSESLNFNLRIKSWSP
ncbi:1968_t:CDS:1, partial [Gigaspora rosea]